MKKYDQGRAYTNKERVKVSKRTRDIIEFMLGLKWKIIYYSYLKPFKSKEIENRYKYSEEIIERQRVENKKLKNPTLYIMGSGYSINEISKEEWKKIRASGKVFSYNNFYRGQFVPIDYHLLKDVRYGSMLNKKNRLDIRDDMNLMTSNPYFKNTNYFIFVQVEKLLKAPYLAIRGCAYIYFLTKLLNSSKSRVGFFSHIDSTVPQKSIRGLPFKDKETVTICELINIGMLMGFKEIILVGVDLYDFRYFWQKEAFKPGPHDIAEPMVNLMKKWRGLVKKQGVELYVYNPKSLLNKVLPVKNFKKK